MNRLLIAAIVTLATLQTAFAQSPRDPAWIMVQHDVADVDAWRKVFDSGLEIRQDAGEMQFQVLTLSGPANSIIGIFEWTSAEAALAFVNDPLVRGAMQSAGVISEPVITLHENDPRYWMSSDDGAADVP